MPSTKPRYRQQTLLVCSAQLLMKQEEVAFAAATYLRFRRKSQTSVHTTIDWFYWTLYL